MPMPFAAQNKIRHVKTSGYRLWKYLTAPRYAAGRGFNKTAETWANIEKRGQISREQGGAAPGGPPMKTYNLSTAYSRGLLGALGSVAYPIGYGASLAGSPIEWVTDRIGLTDPYSHFWGKFRAETADNAARSLHQFLYNQRSTALNTKLFGTDPKQVNLRGGGKFLLPLRVTPRLAVTPRLTSIALMAANPVSRAYYAHKYGGNTPMEAVINRLTPAQRRFIDAEISRRSRAGVPNARSVVMNKLWNGDYNANLYNVAGNELSDIALTSYNNLRPYLFLGPLAGNASASTARSASGRPRSYQVELEPSNMSRQRYTSTYPYPLYANQLRNPLALNLNQAPDLRRYTSNGMIPGQGIAKPTLMNLAYGRRPARSNLVSRTVATPNATPYQNGISASK